jgi:hypothetical protein
MNHIQSDHSTTTWTCMMCSLSETFPKSESFAEHINLVHRETVLSDEIPAILSMCQLSSPWTVSLCPLCRWADAEPGRPVEPNSLLEHVAEHLHSFSLRSLPWPPLSEESNKATFTNSVGESYFNKWLEEQFCQPPSDKSGEQHTTITEALVKDHVERAAFFESVMRTMSKDLDEELTQDDYFHKNAYFGDSTQCSSVADNQTDRDASSSDPSGTLNDGVKFADDPEDPSPEAQTDLYPLSQTKISLLSLDGGGMRGLSMLLILKDLMDRLNQSRGAANLKAIKPCHVFDLIAGTGTGG